MKTANWVADGIKAELDRQTVEQANRDHAQAELRHNADQVARTEAAQRWQEEEFALTPEGRLDTRLRAIQTAAETSADSLRQIRNCIAALLILGLISFLAGLFSRGV
jgi:16S rRNA C967 or C1407 C5-methylase (RsmB/RsmF family)